MLDYEKMNSRLEKLYQNIESESKEQILESGVIIDNEIGRKIWGITMQAKLDDKTKQSLASAQEEIKKINPNNLTFLKLDTFHVSFRQVVWWNFDYPPKGRKKTWEDVSENFLQKLNELDNKFGAIEIRFDRFVATKAAIICCALDQNDELQKLREKFEELLPFPKPTPKKNSIIHVTLARYKENIPNPEVFIKNIKSIKVNIKSEINKIEVLNERYIGSNKGEKILAEVNLIQQP